MEITVKDVIEKYDVDIDLDKMTSKLKDLVLLSDDKDFYLYEYFGDVTLDDVKKPKLYEREEYLREYTYKVKDGEIRITFAPNDYRTMTINIDHPVDDTTYTWGWTYNGGQIIY